MALKPLEAQRPIGVYDGYDSQISGYLGGEVVSITGVLVGTDKATADVEGTGDGYVGVAHQIRPVVTKTLVSGMRPLFLADEGTSGYGTLFGQVVGASFGQVVNTGSQLGPHTALGTGKITLWNYPGRYAVTTDAVDTTAATGLVPTNTTLSVGDPLYATSAGLLTPNASARFENYVVARFVEFETSGSKVSTPVSLTAALNSPSSGGTAVKTPFDRAVIFWNPGV